MAVAETIRKSLENAGLVTEVHEFDVLLSTPKSIDVELTEPNREPLSVLEPADPDVNNHLGDAYWKVGRKVEADFQWRRVLTLDPTPKLKAEVQAKLASGLDRPGAPVVAVK